MKKKIMIIIISVIVVVLGFFAWRSILYANYTIPQDYKWKVENKMSHLDGADIIYYVYDNEILVEEINHYPDGQYSYTKEHTIILYSDVDTSELNITNIDKDDNFSNINGLNNNAISIKKLIENKNGKTVYKRKS